MRHNVRSLYFLVLAAAFAGSPSIWAQVPDCNQAVEELRRDLADFLKPADDVPELVNLEEEVTRRIHQTRQETESEVQSAVKAGRAKTVNRAQHLTAPGSVQNAGSVVSGADFATLLGLAAENDLISQEDDLITFNLSPFSVRALGNSNLMTDQQEYEKTFNQGLRRIGLKVVSGGKGEKFDRDGDGEADDPLEAEKFDDILTWEVQWRFRGSRDVRDPENYRKLARAALDEEGGRTILDEFDSLVADQVWWKADNLAQIGAMEARAVDAVLRPPEEPSADSPAGGRADESNKARQKAEEDLSGCVLAGDAKRFLERVDVAEPITALRERTKTLDAAVETQIEQIENNDLWTLVVGGVERKDDFGPDKRMAAIRGAHRGWSFNLEWSLTAALAAGMPEPETWKLGVERTWKVLQGAFEEPGTFSLSGAYEVYDEVPDALHDEIGKVAAKLEFPIREGLKVPISLTWANHEDLLTDEDEVRGHIGLSYDFSKLFKDDASEPTELKKASKAGS